MTARTDSLGQDDSPAARYAAARARTETRRTRLADFGRTLPFLLDTFQTTACAALEAGRGVLLAAPTGAGKTVVGEFAVHLALATGRKAFYTAPIKALSNQKFGDLVRRHGPEAVGLLTGDTSINPTAPVVVMTTEVLRNMLYADSPALAGLGYVVMDEVHYLADRFRGPVWEEVIIHLPADVLLVSLSATVSNAEEFGDWLQLVRGDTTVVVTERRPVPLWQHVLVSSAAGVGARASRGGADLLDLYAGDVDPTTPGVNPPINPDLLVAFRSAPRSGRGDRGYRGPGGRRPGRPASPMAGPPASRRTPSRVAVVAALDTDGLLPAIYFVFSRAGCEAAVTRCMLAGLRLTRDDEEEEIRRVIADRSVAIPAEDLKVLGFWGWQESLAHGIAAHHAGMLPVFKETVEELFGRGLIKVVFATETLSLGINMPARSVVLEKLVKWDGTAHNDVTPGEYTQLTGRAGRRGIDIEGHAVVVDHAGLDPVHLAGLASRRTYPLRSSFRPTYNMAVNLVAQVGRDRARQVLETSFAQFQADRAVVGLARQVRGHAEAMTGYAGSMACDRGDFAQYMAIRRRISAREADLSRAGASARRAHAAQTFERLRRGDVVEVPSGRRAGYVVVIDVGRERPGSAGPGGWVAAAGTSGSSEPRPTVLTQDKQVRRLALADAPTGLRAVTRMRIPKAFNPRVPAHRRDLAAGMRAALAAALPEPAGGGRAPNRTRSAAADDAELARLRADLRAHPCHGCPDRETHARWAERWAQSKKEHDALVKRVDGRTGSIARVFDRICEILVTLGYLERADAVLRVTADGQWLRRLYAENDLLIAECVRRGVWDRLDPAGLAAALSAVVYSGRREGPDEPHIPGGPGGPLAAALDATVRAWSDLTDLEAAQHIETVGPLDLGLVAAVHRWGRGASLDAVLRDSDLAAGDFVRWCKQILDVLDQLAGAAPRPELRRTAARAIEALQRGVVAYSSI